MITWALAGRIDAPHDVQEGDLPLPDDPAIAKKRPSSTFRLTLLEREDILIAKTIDLA